MTNKLDVTAEINALKAINSLVIQQACVQEIRKFVNCNIELDYGWANNRIKAKLIGPLDFWALPADCLSCDVSTLRFEKSFKFECPDYNTAITCDVVYDEPLPNDMLAVLYMLNKVEVSSSSWVTKNVVCKF